ncbi:phage tail tape measure protein [Actinosynnema mirum]|uniref:Phage tail tape measure protein, TP901 family n=1 Tax=Actinosynnema mirum (strain ATCC 29888 / DSM 43827 / JCM 3225 / NBRC 14064 / NCIMB 13271 / NRRL B-12336 / IMRU 3971 / 101) TaxID=446462 RepID=C6WC63_ACTMD|nr:phage tail tape measure protein [Actinosynnema mirum]ACU39451.1 phage tail tape measure protein, TP901 family [Actinosynnema mirum DSM 43827]
MAGGRIDIEVRADTSKVAGDLERGLRGAAGAANRLSAGLGLAAGTAGIAAGLKSIIEVGNEYAGNLNELMAVTQATGAEMAAAGRLAQDLGSDLTLPATSAADAASAMKELAKGGLDLDEAMTAARGTLQLAAAAQVDAAQAAEIQSDALNQFGLSADQASHVADVLANTANAASGEITDMAGALKYVGPVAKAVGADIDQVATAIGLIATQGIRGEQAGTSLRGMIASLAAPSKPAAKALGELGVEAFDTEGKFVGLRTVTEQLAAAKARMTEATFALNAATAFGNEGMTVASALASTGAQAFDEMAEAVGREGGAADVAAAKTEGLGGAIDGLQSQLESAGIGIYEAIDEPLEAVVRSLAEAIDEVGPQIARGLETAVAAGRLYGPGLAAAIRERGQVVVQAARDVLMPIARGSVGPVNTAINAGIKLFADFTAGLRHVVDAARPVAHGIGEIASASADGDGPVSALATAIGLLGDGVVAVTSLLGPAGEGVGGLLSGVASLPGPVLTAVASLVAYRVAVGALQRSEVGGGLRQFVGEIQAQRQQARESGEQIGLLSSTVAAYQASQLPAIATTRRFTDAVGELRGTAASAGRPIGVLSASVGALAERSPAVAAMRSTYRSTFDSISQSSERAGLAVGIASESLIRGVQSLPSRVSAAVQAVPTAVGVAAIATADRARQVISAVQAIPTGIGLAAVSMADRARSVVSAVQAIPTGVGLAAVATADRARQIVSAIQAIPTGIGVAAVNIADRARSIGSSIASGLDRVPDLAQRTVTALGTLGAAAGAATTALGRGLLSAANDLVGALGGPAGLAIAAASVGLSILAGRQQDAAQRAAQHEAATRSLAEALRDSNYAITENIRLQAAKTLQDRGASDLAKELQIPLSTLTDAYLGNSDALSQVNGVLDTYLAQVEGQGQLEGQVAGQNPLADKAFELRKILGELIPELGNNVSKQKDLDEALKNGRASMSEATETGRSLASALGVLSSNASSANDRARALRTALDALAGGQVDFQAAQARVYETLSRISEAFGQNIDKTQGWGQSLLNVDGSLNITTKNGRTLREMLSDLTGQSADLASAAYDLSISQGEGVSTALDKATAAAQKALDGFLDLADEFGITREQALILAESMGLIPRNVAVALSTPGDEKTKQELLLVKSMADQLPPDKPITVRTLSEEAKKKLEELGYKVQTTPNGVTITASTKSAEEKLNEFLNKPSTKTVTVIYTGGKPAPNGPMGVNHDGNIIKRFAEGGLHKLMPMSAGIAQIVPPNTWRVVGDRLVDDEAYIPINRSRRSQELLAYTASEMGYDLIRRWAVGGVASTTSSMPQSSSSSPMVAPQITNNISVRDNEDAYVTAQVVSSTVAFQARTRR